MVSQAGPSQGATVPEETFQQTHRRRPTSMARTVVAKAIGVDTAHDDMMSDDADGGKDINAAQQRRVSRHNQHPHHHSTSFSQHRTSPRVLGPSNSQEREIARLYELPDKVDSLSVNMTHILNVVEKLQHGDNEKEALQKALKEAQEKLQKTAAEALEARKLWKQTASQLDKLRSPGTGLYPLTDSDLERSLAQLRHNILTISVQFFAGKPPAPAGDPPAGDFWKYVLETTPGSHLYLAYLNSETRGSIIVQSFLWRLFIGEIFNKFCWVPQINKSIAQTYAALDPSFIYRSGERNPTTPETERRFQMWKAATSNLALEFIHDHEKTYVRAAMEDFAGAFCQQVLDTISPFMRNSAVGGDFLEQLQEIVEQAIALDQDICRQVARIDWIFPASQDPVLFKPNYMEMEVGEAAPRPGQHVDVVVVPALKKRGKSTGDGFETEYLLCKMVVTCAPGSLSPGPSSNVEHVAS